MSERDNIFGTVFLLFFAFLLLLIGATITSKFLGVWGGIVTVNSVAYAAPHTIFSTVFGIFDNSFIFIALVALLLVPISAYMHPSQAAGVLDIFLLLAVAYVFIFFNTFSYTLNSVMSANTLLPNSYSFFSNHYTLFVIMAIAIFAVILNFRKVPSADFNGYEMGNYE